MSTVPLAVLMVAILTLLSACSNLTWVTLDFPSKW